MQINEAKLNAFLEAAVYDLAAGYGGVMVSLGDKLGLYKTMDGAGRLSPDEVAERTQCATRYVREWLNSQAAAGYIDYHTEDKTYELPAEHAMVLAQSDSPVFIPHAWNVPASMWFDEAKTLEAFRTGKGVSWDDHDGRLFCGVAAFYRNAYRGDLVSTWLPSLRGMTDKLAAGIKTADIGCGHGHSTILMAEAFPESTFHGFDYHHESIEEARANAIRAGVDDRVRFDVASAKDYPADGFDLICFFDCLHDMGDPVGAARHAASALAENGTVMLVEPYAGDTVEDNLNPIGRLYYSASSTICCAHALSEDGGMALGAQAGKARLEQVFNEAGFRHFRTAMHTPFNLILEARR
jgi:SAM-dependent methyltransferase